MQNIGVVEEKAKTDISILQRILYQTISKAKDYSIFLLNGNGLIESWNDGAQMMFGYDKEEILQRNYSLFFPKENLNDAIHIQLLDKVANSGHAKYEGYFIRKDGSRFWGNLSFSSAYDPVQNKEYFLTVINDLTEKRLAEDKLGNIIEDLQTKNTALNISSDKFHKMISEIKDYAIIFIDPAGKILEWNKGAEQLKGYTAEEITGKNFRLFYTLEDKELKLPEKLLGQARENGVAYHEGYRVRKDGTRFWGGITITAITDKGGKITGFTKVTKDLTARKMADDKVAMFTFELQQKNEELRRSEERYHKMISEVQDYAILLLDKQGIIQNWNSGAEVIKGYRSNEIIGKNFRIFYTPEDIKSRLPERLLQEAEDKGKATSEGWRVRKDGSKFWASIVITALHDVEGNVIGYSKVTRDLTDKKAAEDAIKQNAHDLEIKNMSLEKLNAELSSFAYIVSHDFKEPIRKIQTFAGRQLESDKSPDQIRDFSNKIISSAARMQQLMESLLSYSLISSQPNGMEHVNLNEIFDAVKSDLEVPIQATHAQIISGTLPNVMGIPYQLHQLFLNLLSNSIKFTRAGIKPRINVESTIIGSEKLPQDLLFQNKQYHLITISDNGIGFEPEQSNKIFDVFQRLHPYEFTKGTGIGLSIVKKVVENHFGIIKAEGRPENGATFRIYLPVYI